ncbi:hypothetical protein P168DRAFT_293637 [Aspergillus campestris IBT 28561]|uniref:Uncharacterized protein n=1 Tax=Aspergillus campestris (strain IBT 28561) TaxID=1392248 RepID=A0A2I1CRZ5_ASPC2|nr:uncharacterized protein P168DRAFT_293637 [Aspergillus campestris IBT 28561]PKY00385.1 hypothetical protein P168DRAFT_293637 [Aspergillus campestris IBT 28561]
MIDKDYAGHNCLGCGCGCWWYHHRDSESSINTSLPVFQSFSHNTPPSYFYPLSVSVSSGFSLQTSNFNLQSSIFNLQSSIFNLQSQSQSQSLQSFCHYISLWLLDPVLQYLQPILQPIYPATMDKKESTRQQNGTVAASDLAQYQARWEQIHNDTIRQIQQAREKERMANGQAQKSNLSG